MKREPVDKDELFHFALEYMQSLISHDGQDVETLRPSFQEGVVDDLELQEFQKLCDTAIAFISEQK
jgi:hypothetical protein